MLLVSPCAAQKWTARMDSLAHKTEAEFAIPHGACRAFGLQESNYNPYATRVESGFFNSGSRYGKQIAANAAKFLAAHDYAETEAVERSQRSISFGMFQIMGENFRAMGYCEEFINPTLEEQFEYFGKFVAPLFKRYKSLARVASAYNTGSPDKTYRPYVKHILTYQKKFSY